MSLLISSEEGEESQFLSDGEQDDSLEEDSDEDNMSCSSDLEGDQDDKKDADGRPLSTSSTNLHHPNQPYHNHNHNNHHQVAPPPPPLQAQMLSFGPPYYGRPPTPLPPSPSLTSLLRPSRPTTPDASDDDGTGTGGHGSSGLHGSATGGNGRGAHGSHGNGNGHGHGGGGGTGTGTGHDPVPRASPKVPTYEYYGFVLYLFSSLCFLIYLLWSYLPSPFLHVLGIYYYPNRWWSLAIPSFLVMMLVYIYVALALYNTEYLTLPLGSLETIVDEAGKIAVLDGKGRIVTSEERRRNIERERERVEGLAALQELQHDHASSSSSSLYRRHHQRKSSGNGYGGGGGGGWYLQQRERDIDWRECWNEGTDAVMDVPLAGVCEVLYGGTKGMGDNELGNT